MSPSPGDAPPSSRSPETNRPGGLAGVLKGLAAARLTATRSPPPPPPPPKPLSSHRPSPAPRPPTGSSSLGPSIIATKLEALAPNHLEALELLRNGTLDERAAAAGTLRYAIAEYPFRPVVDIWDAAKDLIEPSRSVSTRTAGWELLTECGRHPASTDLERREYFQTVTAASTAHPDDFHLQLAALVDLTGRGRHLAGFEYDVIPVLTGWLRDAYGAVRAARKQARDTGAKARMAQAGGEEKNLTQLFAFIRDVIKFCFNVASEGAVSGLVDCLLHVCMNTNGEEDLRSCVSVIDAVVTFGTMPRAKLRECVHVLSSIYSMVPGLDRDAWHTISILCRSHSGQAIVRILLDMLRTPRREGASELQFNRGLRGSLAVIKRLLVLPQQQQPQQPQQDRRNGEGGEEKKRKKDDHEQQTQNRQPQQQPQQQQQQHQQQKHPTVPLALLADGLVAAVRSATADKVHLAAFEVINALFSGGAAADARLVNPIMVDEDWTGVLEAAAVCAKRVPDPPPPGSGRTNDEQAKLDRALRSEMTRLIGRVEALLRAEDSKPATATHPAAAAPGMMSTMPTPTAAAEPSFIPRRDLVRFLADVHRCLPDSAANSVLDYVLEFRYCSPPDPEWRRNLSLVHTAFFANRARSSLTRLKALQAIVDVVLFTHALAGGADKDRGHAGHSNNHPAERDEKEKNGKGEAQEVEEEVAVEEAAEGKGEEEKEDEQDEELVVAGIIQQLAAGIGAEDDIPVLETMARLMSRIAPAVDPTLFDLIIRALDSVIASDKDRLRARSPAAAGGPRPGTPTIFAAERPAAGPAAGPTPSNVATRGYAAIFFRSLHSEPARAVRALDRLISIAGSAECEGDARLTAMKVLFRLRADGNNRIHLATHLADVEYLADSLYRTEAAMARKQAEDAFQAGRLSRGAGAGESPMLVSRPSRGFNSFNLQGQGQAPERSTPIRTASAAAAATAATTATAAQRYQPMWTIPDADPVLKNLPVGVSPLLVSYAAPPTHPAPHPSTVTVISMAAWLETLLAIFRRGADWEVYSFMLVHLPAQLSNHAVFRGAIPQIQALREVICHLVQTNTFSEPGRESGLRRADVAICFYHSLTMLLSYHAHFQKVEEDDMVKTFVYGISGWERSARCCIHALSICCHELPLSTGKLLPQTLKFMATIITQPRIAIHVLEFLACLSRMPAVTVNLQHDEYRTVFGICFRYLQYVRDRRRQQQQQQQVPVSVPPAHHHHHRTSAITSEPTGSAVSAADHHPVFYAQATAHPPPDDLPQYVYALAYHVILFWFLALKLPDRPGHVGWIAKNLFADLDGGGPGSEEQAVTTLDYMQRVAYADAGESSPEDDALFFTEDRFGPIVTRHWLVGNSIMAISQATGTGWARVTKRQPSGTSSYILRETFTAPQPHQARGSSLDVGSRKEDHQILPSHLLVQMFAPVLPPLPGGGGAAAAAAISRPIPLPDDDDAVRRAIRIFDRTTPIDGHKVGVVYVAEGQTHEADILANVSGSRDYVEFLAGLGTLVRLRGATFNTQGLDREHGTDGEYTFAWRDRVTEMVFHVTTQMPTDLGRDPQCTGKKRHIGNDFVNIIFNDSGLPFRFDTFPSEFNYVNIVITPEARATFVAQRTTAPESKKDHGPFYKINVMSKPGFPDISPASQTKMISLRALPGFIRLIALNASVFSLVWANREGGEHVGSWRSRLREINRLREKYGPAATGIPAGAAGTAGTATAAGLITSPGGAVAGHFHSQGQQLSTDPSRPGSSVPRESAHSLRRTSVATFLTGTSEQTSSHRSSTLSTTATLTSEAEMGAILLDSVVEAVDFSKWAS